MQSPFIGIDLTSSPEKASACIGLDKDLKLVFAGFLSADSDIVALVSSHSPDVVAIDAPLTLPRGFCCLEEDCLCHSQYLKKGRQCERDLAKLAIPCYFTGKKSIIKKMVYRGIGIRENLERRGYQVIEVYPYASKVCLWGKPIPSKLKPAGLDFLRSHLVSLIPSLNPYIADFNHDLCDAAIAAYTACLYHRDRTEQIGDIEEGVVYIPSR